VASAGPCASLHLTPDRYASTPPLSFFTGRMPFHPPNQQHQSTEGKYGHVVHEKRKQTRRYTVKGRPPRHVDYDAPQPSDGGVKLLIYRWNSATTVQQIVHVVLRHGYRYSYFRLLTALVRNISMLTSR